MKVFVTGGTGFVGSAVVNELLSSGHEVTGLARSEAASNQLIVSGASVYNGDLQYPETLAHAVFAADAVVHLGFIHDFSRFKEMCTLDKKVIESIGNALVGTSKPFIVTSAIGVIKKQGLISENNKPENSINPRVSTEIAVDEIASKGVNTSIVRLPPVVHDNGDKYGFLPTVIKIAKEKGVSACIENGNNLWPAVHRQDAAKLYRSILEHKPNDQPSIYHAVAEQGVVYKEIANVIAERLNIPTQSIPLADTEAHWGLFAHFAKFDLIASSAVTQQVLNWHPTAPTLLSELNSTVYFPNSD